MKLFQRSNMMTAPPPLEPNPLRRAMDNYEQMEQDLLLAKDEVRTLVTENDSLRAEVEMLRGELERADADRQRLTAVSATLLGRLHSIQDVVAGAVRDSIRNGIEAATAAAPERTEDVERAAGEVRDILERLPQSQLPERQL